MQFELAESDCVSLVDRSIALALATDWQSYYRLTERLRHKDGTVTYKNRNFFTLGDWLPNNTAWLLHDITPELNGAESFTHVVRPKVFEERPAAAWQAHISARSSKDLTIAPRAKKHAQIRSFLARIFPNSYRNFARATLPW